MRKILSFLCLAIFFADNSFGQITSADQIDETKVYTIVSERGALSQNGTELTTNTGSVTSSDYWAFVKYAGSYYLYSVATNKFVQALPNTGSKLQDYSTSALNFFVPSGNAYNANYPISFSIARWGVNTQTGGNVILNTWTPAQSSPNYDAGNRFKITAVEGVTFDASAAQTALEEAYSTLTGQIFTLEGARGALYMADNTLKPTGTDSNKNAYKTIDSSDESQQFAFVLYKSQLYIYNVGADKFLMRSGESAVGRDFEGTVFNILYDEVSKKFMFTLGSLTMNNNNSGAVKLDNWISPDDGNIFTLTKVKDFDDSYLQQKLNTADVTFVIEDTEGNPLGSKTIKYGVGTHSTAPSAADLNLYYYTLEAKESYTVETGQSNTATLVATWNGPFSASSSLDDDAIWYALNVRNTTIGLVTDDGAMSVTNAYSLNNVLGNDVWAFKGNNVSGFSIYNKKSGLYLTKPAGTTLEEAYTNGTGCTLSQTPNSDWLVMPTDDSNANNNGAFLVYEKEGERYKLNQYGGATSSMLGYYDSKVDAGNFFYASSTIDFVKNVTEEMLNNPVGLIFGFESERAKSGFQDRYDALASSETLSDFTTLYYDIREAQVQPSTGWYQFENLYTGNNFVIEAAADGQLIGRRTIVEASNDINTFVKYDKENGLLSLQGKYIPTHDTDASVISLGETGGKMTIAQIGNRVNSYIYFTEGSGLYNKLYLNYGSNPYTLRTYYSENPSNVQWYIHPKTGFSIKMNSGQGEYWATLYAPFGVELPEGTKAYVGKLGEDAITLTPIGADGTSVPAGTPVVLKGNSANIEVTINDNIAAVDMDNDLQGQYLAFTGPSEDVLSLGISEGEVGFYRYAGTIGSNRAFVNISDLHKANARGYKFIIVDDDVTGIETAANDQKPVKDAYYDLAGRRVTAPQNGSLYIVNGKVVKY